jgi:uncharacterized membrane protein SirB2
MSFLALKHLHVSAVVLSALGFLIRGALVWRESPLAERPWLRRSSHSIDTVLLCAALGMLWVGHRNPFAEPWLATKIACLIAYIVVGALALKRAPTLRLRRTCFVLAVLLLANIVTVALTRNSWGLAGLFRPAGY